MPDLHAYLGRFWVLKSRVSDQRPEEGLKRFCRINGPCQFHKYALFISSYDRDPSPSISINLQGIGEEPPNFREGGQSVQPSDGEPEPPPQEEGVAGKGREGKGRDQIEGEMARWVSEPLTRDSTSK